MNTQPSMPARFELPARTASGIVLGVAAVLALLAGGVMYSALLAVGAIAALREWHRLVNGGQLAREMIPTGLAMIAVVWAAQEPNGLALSFLAISLGAAARRFRRRCGACRCSGRFPGMPSVRSMSDCPSWPLRSCATSRVGLRSSEAFLWRSGRPI